MVLPREVKSLVAKREAAPVGAPLRTGARAVWANHFQRAEVAARTVSFVPMVATERETAPFGVFAHDRSARPFTRGT